MCLEQKFRERSIYLQFFQVRCCFRRNGSSIKRPPSWTIHQISMFPKIWGKQILYIKFWKYYLFSFLKQTFCEIAQKLIRGNIILNTGYLLCNFTEFLREIAQLLTFRIGNSRNSAEWVLFFKGITNNCVWRKTYTRYRTRNGTK